LKYPFRDFQKVSLKHFIFLFRKHESGSHRIIFKLKKAHYGAVVRNRIKRIVRERIRSLSALSPHTLVVVSAGRPGKDGGAALKSDLESLVRIII
jgi:ribonuclease P protein component